MNMTRREFLKESLAAMGFLALPGLPVFAAPALWKPAKKAKLEVVKCCQCGNVAKSNVVKSNVANTRLGLGIGTGNTGNTGKISIKIPMADGNAAALERLEEAKRRFDDFMSGRAATIEEFDEAVRPFGESQKREMIGW